MLAPVTGDTRDGLSGEVRTHLVSCEPILSFVCELTNFKYCELIFAGCKPILNIVSCLGCEQILSLVFELIYLDGELIPSFF